MDLLRPRGFTGLYAVGNPNVWEDTGVSFESADGETASVDALSFTLEDAATNFL